MTSPSPSNSFTSEVARAATAAVMFVNRNVRTAVLDLRVLSREAADVAEQSLVAVAQVLREGLEGRATLDVVEAGLAREEQSTDNFAALDLLPATEARNAMKRWRIAFKAAIVFARAAMRASVKE